ncbi:hypothetical protein GCM10022198_00140 [Klugiella xanthotipulae]|uniref:Minor tail protein n=1 Tax=Klugiella xanthotipulae TaxID=244735 RepID=A0A543I5H6_9MICO|nr:hypothetical protein [Klugiella xanthotipulae]TQM65845.1 hypothetical protein FB466_0659 [Klugiella xanthotipulae]
MTSWYIFETLSGHIITEFTPLSGSWTARLNEAETLDVSIDLGDPDEQSREWRSLGTPWKYSIAVEESGRFYGGPIQPHDWDEDSAILKITARGIRSIFALRSVLPVEALTTDLVDATGAPNTLLDTTLKNLDLGSIGMRVIQQACTWPGSNYPIVFPPARSGTHERTYQAVTFPTVEDTLSALSGVIGGPDFDFRLRLRNPSYFEWEFLAGTQDEPRLISPDTHTWDLSAPDSAGSDLTVSTNPSSMASLSWAVGGRGDNSVLVAQAYDPLLIQDDHPLLEAVDTSRTSVSVMATLAGHAQAPLRTGRRPWEFWKFSASLRSTPFLSEYQVGDLCTLAVHDSPYIPAGEYTRRIVALSGDDTSDWVKITLGEVYDG